MTPECRHSAPTGVPAELFASSKLLLSISLPQSTTCDTLESLEPRFAAQSRLPRQCLPRACLFGAWQTRLETPRTTKFGGEATCGGASSERVNPAAHRRLLNLLLFISGCTALKAHMSRSGAAGAGSPLHSCSSTISPPSNCPASGLRTRQAVLQRGPASTAGVRTTMCATAF